MTKKLWKCIHCGRKLGARHIIHRCKGTLRKRNRFTKYTGDDQKLISLNQSEFHHFKKRIELNQRAKELGA